MSDDQGHGDYLVLLLAEGRSPLYQLISSANFAARSRYYLLPVLMPPVLEHVRMSAKNSTINLTSTEIEIDRVRGGLYAIDG